MENSKNRKNIVIIPAFRPSEVLVTLVESLGRENQVLVVDDGSGEAYKNIFQQLPLVLTHERNMGKGHGIKTALQYIQQNHSQEEMFGIVTVDCDGQHSVEDALHVMETAVCNPGQLILGARDFQGNIPWKSKLGNSLTRSLFRIMNHCRLQDTQTGLRGFTSDMLTDFLRIPGERYEYEMRVLSFCAKNKISIKEVPIQTIYHDAKNTGTHFRAVRDSLLVYQDMIKFTLSSLSSFLVDYILFGIFILLFAKLPGYILLSNIAARMISAAYNYLLNAKLVFRMEKATVKSAVQYFLLAIFILCMNNIVLSTILYVTGLPAMIAKIITELILFLMSFFIQHLVIFRKKK